MLKQKPTRVTLNSAPPPRTIIEPLESRTLFSAPPAAPAAHPAIYGTIPVRVSVALPAPAALQSSDITTTTTDQTLSPDSPNSHRDNSIESNPVKLALTPPSPTSP
jgi:hypothetical protein